MIIQIGIPGSIVTPMMNPRDTIHPVELDTYKNTLTLDVGYAKVSLNAKGIAELIKRWEKEIANGAI